METRHGNSNGSRNRKTVTTALAALTVASVGSLVYFLGMRRRRLNYWMRMRKAGLAVGAGARELGSSVALHANRLQRRLFS